ncbi:MAG: alpha/beta hydrolase, partial [Solirubrobacterales bacterium]|nr:alpha/beta hydrolase [Solirubrobacterales bacterium]
MSPVEAAGLSLVRPYVRGKIPVVLIHGLGSGPRSWSRTIEAVEADPILRENYQFWTFGYRTGEPILYSASVLRRALIQARERYDPEGSDPAFDGMVLIGHSLGGLLAKLMAQDSRSRLWELVSAQPAERLGGPREARESLRQAFFFKPLPGVRRIIFIATPHRGSRLDRGAIHSIGSRIIRHEAPLQRARAMLLESNRPDFFLDTFREGLPSSVDQLRWEHPLLLALCDLGIDPAVDYHSIMADRRDPPRGGGTDGIVPHDSAHLDGAGSEFLVHGGHLCQDHPLVIRECRRILTEHLVRIVTRPDGDRADAPDANPGSRTAHRSQVARPRATVTGRLRPSRGSRGRPDHSLRPGEVSTRLATARAIIPALRSRREVVPRPARHPEAMSLDQPHGVRMTDTADQPTLEGCEPRGPPRTGASEERFTATDTNPSDPAAHRVLRHPRRICDVTLRPALLLQ